MSLFEKYTVQYSAEISKIWMVSMTDSLFFEYSFL